MNLRHEVYLYVSEDWRTPEEYNRGLKAKDVEEISKSGGFARWRLRKALEALGGQFKKEINKVFDWIFKKEKN